VKIFALDTNIISYLLKGDISVFERYSAEIENGNDCIIPPVTYYEIKRGLLIRNASRKTAAFDGLCKAFGVEEMNTETWDEAARLYALNNRSCNPMEDADLFIAAFCLVGGYTLVTNNTKHFHLIDGLHLENWK
jgi:predicted nucleic acid-binding protein